jgi:hypothetical protein
MALPDIEPTLETPVSEQGEAETNTGHSWEVTGCYMNAI